MVGIGVPSTPTWTVVIAPYADMTTYNVTQLEVRSRVQYTSSNVRVHALHLFIVNNATGIPQRKNYSMLITREVMEGHLAAIAEGVLRVPVQNGDDGATVYVEAEYEVGKSGQILVVASNAAELDYYDTFISMIHTLLDTLFIF